jgi:general secretion pathway protein C
VSKAFYQDCERGIKLDKTRMKIVNSVTFCLINLILFGFLYSVDDFPPYSLSGVVVAQNTSSSVAVLKNVKTGKTFIKTVGDRIFDMELTHVFEDGIILKKGEKIYWLLLDKGFQFKTDKETPQNSKGDERVELDNNLPNREFVRSEVQKRAEQERTLIIKETRVVPNYVDGKIDGFKVIGLPKDGIVTEVGIHKDDVIKEVNGVKLSNLTALVMLYSKFSEEERYEVLIERDKKLIRQVYILK